MFLRFDSLHILSYKWLTSWVELSFTLRPTVSWPVCLGIKHPFGAYDQIFITCVTITVFFLWGALSDERTGLTFIYAAGPCQRSLSRVRVPWISRPYFTVSHLCVSTRLTSSELVSVITSRQWPRGKHRSLLYSNRFRGNGSFVKALLSNGCVYLLIRIFCLAANVVSFFVSRSLASNGCRLYNM
jgi:hypothetical protein